MMQFQSKTLVICLLILSCNESTTQNAGTPPSPGSGSGQKNALPTTQNEPERPTSQADVEDQVDTLPAEEEEEEPDTDQQATSDTDISSILGQWELRDSQGRTMMTIWFTESQVSRKTAITPRFDFPVISMVKKDDLFYVVHQEPIMNQPTDRHCVHKIVEETSQTYLMTECANGMMPIPDWTQFTADNRYIKN